MLCLFVSNLALFGTVGKTQPANRALENNSDKFVPWKEREREKESQPNNFTRIFPLFAEYTWQVVKLILITYSILIYSGRQEG